MATRSPSPPAVDRRRYRPSSTFWLVLSGIFATNAVIFAISEQPLLLTVTTLISGLAALWSAWAESR